MINEIRKAGMKVNNLLVNFLQKWTVTFLHLWLYVTAFKVGIGIKPNTPVESVLPFVELNRGQTQPPLMIALAVRESQMGSWAIILKKLLKENCARGAVRKKSRKCFYLNYPGPRKLPHPKPLKNIYNGPSLTLNGSIVLCTEGNAHKYKSTSALSWMPSSDWLRYSRSILW